MNKLWKNLSFELKAVFLAATAVLIVLVIVYLAAPNILASELGGPEEFGQFGDYIGGLLNPTFGFLTVCLLLYSNKVQKNVSKLSEKEYDRKQIEDGLMQSYERLTSALVMPLNDPVPGTADCYTLEAAKQKLSIQSMHDLHAKLHSNELPVQLQIIFGETQGLIIQTVALTIDLIELTRKDSLKELWVRRTYDLLFQFYDYGIIGRSLLVNCQTEITSKFDLALRNSFSNKMHGNVPA